MKNLLLLLIIICSYSTLNAQYKSAVGLRGSVTAGGGTLGGGPGLTFKTFFTERMALDLTVSGGGFGVDAFGNRVGWAVATALVEVHKKFLTFEGLNYYFGGGVHLGTSSWGGAGSSFGFSGGVDGVIGAEYQFTGYPFAISADVIPAVSFGSGPGSRVVWSTLSSSVGAKWLFAL